MHIQTIMGLLGGVLALFGGYYYWSNYLDDTQSSIAPVLSTVSFSCAENKQVRADISEGQVSITLSDGRAFTLEQVSSASGVRYANEGDAVVFWTKADDAFVEEGSVMTYRDCIQIKEGGSATSSETTDVHTEPRAQAQSSYEIVTSKIVGKWRGVESESLIYNIKPGAAFQESRVVGSGQFMVPQGSWRIEKVSGTPAVFDTTHPPIGTLFFVRTSEKGEERWFEVREITASTLTLYEVEGGFIYRFTRVE